MKWTNLAKWLWVVPWASALLDVVRSADIWTTISDVAWAVSHVLDAWDSLVNPLFADAGWALADWLFTSVVWWASAWFLTNSILKEFDWMENHKKTRYLINTLAWWAWLAAWSVVTPYLLTWNIAYWAWKHWWKYWKEAWKRALWTAWGMTWWLVKWALKWWWNSVKAWLKWNQTLNPKI